MGWKNHTRGVKESDLKEELQYFVKKKKRVCEIENEHKMKKVPSAPVFFILQTEICMKIRGERNFNIKPLKDTSGFCFLCATKLRAECYQSHV